MISPARSENTKCLSCHHPEVVHPWKTNDCFTWKNRWKPLWCGDEPNLETKPWKKHLKMYLLLFNGDVPLPCWFSGEKRGGIVGIVVHPDSSNQAVFTNLTISDSSRFLVPETHLRHSPSSSVLRHSAAPGIHEATNQQSLPETNSQRPWK